MGFRAQEKKRKGIGKKQVLNQKKRKIPMVNVK